MKTILIRVAVLALILAGLSGCGGGSTGSTGAAGAPGAPSINGAIKATAMTADQWTTFKPNIDPATIKVDMSSGTPVVKFAVTDQNGNPVIGLGGQSLTAANATDSLPAANYNISFTLAKLVTAPGAPSKWVNYLVTKPQKTGTTNASVADGRTWVGTYPTAETQGTMVDNGDGTYQYTFLRDITHAKAIVAGLTDAGANVKADLGDLTYDATLTHRLGIFVAGSQPGTGTATSNAVLVTTAVPMVNTFNIGFDFVPNGSAVTVTRDIVKKDSCTECHQGRAIGHITSNSGITTNPANGVPAGAFIGRNDPRLCVTCHTDQTKYGFTNVVEANGVSGLPQSLTTVYMRTASGEAAFTYPRMIHQFHMGAQNGVVPGSGLVKTGYNLNGHCNNGAAPTVPVPGVNYTVPGNNTAAAAANQAACFNQFQYPQDVRNCTKCHDGSTGAKNKTTDGDNWKNVPSKLACGACHDGIDFAAGTGITLFDRDTDVKAKAAIGTTHSGHPAGSNTVYTDDTQCAGCHTSASIAIVHGAIPTINTAGALSIDPASGVEAASRMPASEVPSLRTMNATITGATISGTDGSVTVNFTLADSAGAAVDMPTAGPVTITAGTNPAGLPFKSLNFTLAKLMPAANGVSTYWKSYTGKCNVNNAAANPNMVTSPVYHNVLQGYSEVAIGQATAAQNLATNSAGKPAMAPGILTSLGGGAWTYKFRLVNAGTHNADSSGDIRTITTAINLNTATPLLSVGGAANPAAAYNWNAVPTCPDDGVTGIAAGTTPPTFNATDATLTHRIGMIFNKNDTLGADNVSNATYDFTPDGNKVAQTRNIVTMASCATCHGGRKIHKGYATELCVTCHNQNTSDPSDALATNTVDLQRIVHKLHYKGTDFWVHGETFGTGSMTGFPGNVMKCQACHNETAVKPATSTSDGKSTKTAGSALENAANWYTTPTSRACGTCHDDTIATAHINSQISGGVEMCITCHGAGSVDGLDAKTAHGKRLP